MYIKIKVLLVGEKKCFSQGKIKKSNRQIFHEIPEDPEGAWEDMAGFFMMSSC